MDDPIKLGLILKKKGKLPFIYNYYLVTGSDNSYVYLLEVDRNPLHVDDWSSVEIKHSWRIKKEEVSTNFQRVGILNTSKAIKIITIYFLKQNSIDTEVLEASTIDSYISSNDTGCVHKVYLNWAHTQVEYYVEIGRYDEFVFAIKCAEDPTYQRTEYVQPECLVVRLIQFLDESEHNFHRSKDIKTLISSPNLKMDGVIEFYISKILSKM